MHKIAISSYNLHSWGSHKIDDYQIKDGIILTNNPALWARAEQRFFFSSAWCLHSVLGQMVVCCLLMIEIDTQIKRQSHCWPCLNISIRFKTLPLTITKWHELASHPDPWLITPILVNVIVLNIIDLIARPDPNTIQVMQSLQRRRHPVLVRITIKS